MRKHPILSAIFLFTVIIQACGGYKPTSRGSISEVLVVMDSASWNSPVADAIRGSFGANIETMPRPEPVYDLRFVDIKRNADLEYIKRGKNIIFVAPLNEESNVSTYISALLSEDVKQRVIDGQNFAFPLRDRWANDQWVLVLTAPDAEILATRIVDSSAPLVSNLDLVERERWTYDVFGKAENIVLADSMYQKHKWRIRVQHDYELSVDTTNFVSLARLLPENYRYVWVFWDDNINDVTAIDHAWIDVRRDELFKQWVEGTRDSSHVVTQYEFPIKTETIDFKGYYGFHTRGAWKMNNNSMGGSFIQYSIYVPDQRRMYYLIGSIFAPAVSHRRFLNQFDAILWTFEPEADSSGNQPLSLTK